MFIWRHCYVHFDVLLMKFFIFIAAQILLAFLQCGINVLDFWNLFIKSFVV